MIKTLSTYLVVHVFLFVLGFYLHQHLIGGHKNVMPFTLERVYIFNSLASFLICVSIFGVSKVEYLKNQLGFLYLGLFIFKLLIFASVFSSFFQEREQLALITKLSLLIPTLIFIAVELFFTVKILGKINTFKK